MEKNIFKLSENNVVYFNRQFIFSGFLKRCHHFFFFCSILKNLPLLWIKITSGNSCGGSSRGCFVVLLVLMLLFWTVVRVYYLIYSFNLTIFVDTFLSASNCLHSSFHICPLFSSSSTSYRYCFFI